MKIDYDTWNDWLTEDSIDPPIPESVKVRIRNSFESFKADFKEADTKGIEREFLDRMNLCKCSACQDVIERISTGEL